MKTLRLKDTKEYVVLEASIPEGYGVSKCPQILADTADFDGLKHCCPLVDFSSMELIDIVVQVKNNGKLKINQSLPPEEDFHCRPDYDQPKKPERTPVDGEKDAEKFLSSKNWDENETHCFTYSTIRKFLMEFAYQHFVSRPVEPETAPRCVNCHKLMQEVKPGKWQCNCKGYEPYLTFKTEAEEMDWKNKYTELVCDRLLNHNPAGKFGSVKMQQIADIIHASRPVVEVTDEEIELLADVFMRDSGAVYSRHLVRRNFISGAKAMREKLTKI